MINTVKYSLDTDPYNTLSRKELVRMKPIEILKYFVEMNSKRLEDTFREAELKYPKMFEK